MKYQPIIKGESYKGYSKNAGVRRAERKLTNKALRKSSRNLQKVEDLETIYPPTQYRKRTGWWD